MTQEHIFDVIIVGGGPVGLFAVFACGMMGLRCCVVENLATLGGQCRTLYPEKPIYDIPAFPAITGEELIVRLEKQMAPFSPTVFLKESALEARCIPQEHPQPGPHHQWEVHTSTGRCLRAWGVVLCAGGGALAPKRPPLENLERYEGTSIFYHVAQQAGFKDKHIVIAGGGDSAVDWALLLAPQAASVHMVHRRHEFRAQEASLRQLHALVEQGLITIYAPYQLHALQGTQDLLQGVDIAHVETGHVTTVQGDYLLPFFGIDAHMGPLLSWGLEVHKGKILTHPTTGETSLAGIYGAGDAAIYPHKLRLIATGFSEVANVAHHMRGYISPEKAFRFQHSTTTGIPSLTP